MANFTTFEVVTSRLKLLAALTQRKRMAPNSSKEVLKACVCVFLQGPRRSSLSCLLAGSDDDEIAEWSESMATPPLKITKPAAAGRRGANDQR